ncbi:MAG: BatA domain-containing protein [Candidatus Zixiibacteriota bacterium]
MFNFLNASVLLAAAAGLIPLIIHLFSRRRVTVIEFSSLKHLKAMQKRQVRRLKIRQLLLLALRMLIIFCAVLAFARPTTTGGSFGTHANVSAVILFDNSASMSRYVADGILFDIAKKRTQEVLQSFGEGDRVCVIPLDKSSTNEIEPSFMSSASADEALGAIRQGYGVADLSAALQSAMGLLEKAQNVNKELYVVSDRQRNSLPDSLQISLDGIAVYLVDLASDDIANLGVTSVSLGGKMLVPGQDFDLVARVRNYGAETRDNVVASLFIGGERVAQTSVTVGPNQDGEARFTRTLAGGGLYDGFVELSDDPYLVDNRFYFSFRVPERFKVLVVSGDVSGQFISLALSPAQGVNQYWDVETRTPDELTGLNFFEYDVICLAGATALPDAIQRRIISVVQNGKSLFVSYGATTNPIEFSSQWGEITGVSYTEGIQRNPSHLGFFTLATMDYNHPVFSVFAETRDSLPQIKFFTLPKSAVAPKAEVMATFSGNRPALVANQSGRGRVLTFCGPLSPEFTDMTSQAFFVPFISRIAEYLASHLSSYDVDLVTTRPVVRPVQLGVGALSPVVIIAPDSARYSTPPEESGSGTIVLKPHPTGLPGPYHAHYNGREIDRFAVNVPPNEGDYQPADPDQFVKAIGAEKFVLVAPSVDAAAIITEGRFGRELWPLFLWAAALLMIAELLVSRTSVVDADS